MSYLTPRDYNKSIQADNLTQIIGGDTSILAAAELTAIEEATSYLVQKYDLSLELTDTPAWDNGTEYKAMQRVFQNASPFPIYSAKLPKPLFQVSSYYNIGDMVFWRNKIYTALRSSIFPDSVSQLQYGEIGSVPNPNVFPDDPVNGPIYWGTGTDYSIPAGTALTDTTYWTAGDNRSQQLLTYIIAITLFYVHMRIAPRNIPDLRVKAYDDAIKWLKACAKGDVTANLKMLQPRQGARIRYGGNVKNKNTY